MVSSLFKASESGDVSKTTEALKDATPVDIEIKGTFPISLARFVRSRLKFRPGRSRVRTSRMVFPTLPDHTGTTPLIVAVKNGHLEVVKMLLAAGTCKPSFSAQRAF
jgi:ankyrin repeat protein